MSKAKTATLGLLALFGANQTLLAQNKDDLKIGKDLEAKSFIDPVVTQMETGNGIRTLSYRDASLKGQGAHVLLDIDDRLGKIKGEAELEEVVGALVRSESSAEVDGQKLKIVETYFSGGPLNDGTGRVIDGSLTTTFIKNGQLTKDGTKVKASAEMVKDVAFKTLGLK